MSTLAVVNWNPDDSPPNRPMSSNTSLSPESPSLVLKSWIVSGDETYRAGVEPGADRRGESQLATCPSQEPGCG